MKKQLDAVFFPVIGRLAWNVRRGEGRYLTMEFGKPHLSVREPFNLRSEASQRVQRLSRMRGAYVSGDWSLFIRGDWKVAVLDRAQHLPSGMQQNIRIDVRGQQVSEKQLEDVTRRIIERSSGHLKRENVRFRTED